MDQNLISLLACPNTGDELKLDQGELFTDKTSYPIFENIPWLFKNPEHSYLEWATKIEGFIEEESIYIKHLQSLLQLSNTKTTSARYSQLIEAKTENLKVLHKTLSMFLGQKTIRLMPSSQQIHSYFQLIFRDWVWETKELSTYAKYIDDKVTSLKNKKVLILGAGACGLGHILAKQNPTSQIISTDHNPFLILVANKLMNGEKVEMFNYSFFPKSIDDTNEKYSIQSSDKLSNHHQVLSSYPDLPFKKDSFDLIVAPWFLDILDSEFSAAVDSSMKFLKNSGEFICIGPANKHSKDIAEQLTSVEMKEILERYFLKSEFENQLVNYLENPIESHQRVENIMFFYGQTKTLKENNSAQKVERKEVLLEPELVAYKQKVEIYNRILKLVDEDMSYDQLAIKIQAEFQFNADEAQFYAESFIKQIKMEL